MKRKLSLLLVLLCNSVLLAQAPGISYSGVQNSYNVNVPITALTPTLTGGAPDIRTNVSTLAGSAASGYADGTSASPKYYSPTGITVSASGNLYIADSQNHCIRKITASGFVSTYAGTGVAGFANGTASAAQFNVPYAVAVDASENVYVIESASNAIRKITATGIVSTFAGNVATAGFLDGQGTTALFSAPKGLDVDASGNIYVADAANNRIRKITASGLVTTVAGNGTAGYLDGQGTSSQFRNPTGVAVASSGIIYVSDTSNNRIRAISASGLVTTFAGSGASGMVNGQGTAAQFNAPRALTIDASGTICVVDYSNNRIRKITNTALVSTLSGTGAFGAVNGAGTSASFKYPEGIAFDASGNIFVADVTNNCIRKITSTGDTSTYSGSAVRGLENGQGGALAMFNSPVAIAVTSSGIAYAIDDFNSCIRKITADGIVSTFAGNSATGYTDGQGSAAYFNGPKGLAVDAAGNIYVADTYNNRIRKITSTGVVTTIAGDGTAGYLDGQGTAAKFNNPYSLTLDSAGNIYVADTKNHRIRKISTSGAVTTVAGYILSGYADGASTVARFRNPQGIAIDNATGILYVADTSNNRIRKIATDGTVSTFAGSFAGYSDGQGTAAYFNNPIGITIDTYKNLYIGDYYNSVIRKVDPTGLVSTYAGNGSSDYADGLGNVASFYFPVGVATDASGAVYVADSYTQRIRKITSVNPFDITPDLPLGLSFNEMTGVVSGTPTVLATTATYTISASNYSGTGTATITFAIGNTSAPAAPTANAQSFCNSAAVANLVATGTALKWYNVSTGGTALAPTTAVSTGTYYVSQTVSSVESSRTAVLVTVNVTAAPTASAQTLDDPASVADLIATGTSLQWYNVSTGGNALAPTAILVSGTYYVSQTLNGCESARTLVQVTINSAPVAPVAPTANAQSFCNSATVANLVATGSALKWYNVPTGGSVLASTVSLISGTYYVSQTVNAVESARTSVAVTLNVTALPTASAQSFCNSATVANLVAAGTALKWYNVSSGGTALASTTALSSGTYYVSQTVNSCEGARASISVTINTTIAPTASAQTFNNSATVANLTATGTGLQWYAVSTGGSALASTTALSSGTYYVSQTLNGCESSRTAVVVTINVAPSAPSASAQFFCNSATVADLVATGTALKWYAVSTGGTALAPTTALTTGSYYVSQTINSLESTRTAVSVTINSTIAPTASAQTFNNSATVANLTATGTGLQWYAVSTGGSALASTTALSSGTYYVSQTLNGCESSRTAVVVTINVAPSAPSASAQSFCNSATVADLVATGTALKWYAVSTGGTALAPTTALTTGSYYVSQTINSLESTRTAVSVTINSTIAPTASAQTFNNSATVANLTATGSALQWYAVSTGGSALASATALSSGTYYVSQTLNGCESLRTAVLVTINIAPAAPTASAQSFCTGATVANLIADGTDLKWYTVLSGGSALATTAVLTTRTYYVSQTVNSIESSRAAVAVTVNNTPTPSAFSQSFCNGATVANLVATGTAIKWYTVGSGGSPLASTAVLTGGILYVSQTINGCESSRMIIGVTINNTAAPTASAQSFTNSATVSNLVATGTALKWYDVASGGTALAPTTALGTGIYYVSQTLNGCESARTLVPVTINSATPAPAASAQSFCNLATVANLVAVGTALKWYSTVTGGTALASTTSLTTGNYYVSQTINSIESSRTIVSVTVNVTPIPTASPQFFCNSATVGNLTANGTSLKWYTALTGGTALLSTTGLVSGYFFVSQTLNGCESARLQVLVTISTVPAPTASSQSLCAGSTVAGLTANGTSLKWYAASAGGASLVPTAFLSSGTYYVSQTLNTCESARTAVSVTVNTTPAPTASAQSFTNSATVGNLVANGSSLQWYDVASGGTALAPATVLSSGTYYVSQTVNGCESSRTAVAVTITAAPVIPSAPSASAQSFCNGATVANLAATGTSLKWYNAASGGTPLAPATALITGTYYVSQTVNSVESARTVVPVTITTITTPSAATQTFSTGATVANLVASGTSLQWYAVATGGTVLASSVLLSSGTYYVSQTVNGCESERTAVSVTVNSVSGAPSASSQSFCNGATVANLVAVGTALKWYLAATGGTVLTATTVLTTRNYYVSQTVNSIESARTLVAVTVITTPPPTVASQSFCSGATVANLVATGTAIKWYTVGTGGTALASTTSLRSGVYYVTQTLNGCESSRMIIGVTVNTTAAPTASAQTFTNAATVANLTASGVAQKWYDVPSGGTVLATSTSLTTGTYYVSQTLNGCESPRIAVSVTVDIAIGAPMASAQSFCSGAVVSSLEADGASLKWYATAAGGTALTSSTALISGNYYVSQTVNSVESPRTLVAVTVFAAPVSQNISSPSYSGSSRSPICTSDNKVLNVASGYSADTIQWEVAVMPLTSTTLPAASAYSVINGATGPSYTVTNAAQGRNYFRARFSNGGCEETAKYSNTFVVYYSGCGSAARLAAVVYPNPFIENFKLSMSSSSGEKVDVFVYDLTGRLVEQREANLEDVSEIELGDRYPSGVFIVNVTQGDNIKTIKVVKR